MKTSKRKFSEHTSADETFAKYGFITSAEFAKYSPNRQKTVRQSIEDALYEYQTKIDLQKNTHSNNDELYYNYASLQYLYSSEIMQDVADPQEQIRILRSRIYRLQQAIEMFNQMNSITDPKTQAKIADIKWNLATYFYENEMLCQNLPNYQPVKPNGLDPILLACKWLKESADHYENINDKNNAKLCYDRIVEHTLARKEQVELFAKTPGLDRQLVERATKLIARLVEVKDDAEKTITKVAALRV